MSESCRRFSAGAARVLPRRDAPPSLRMLLSQLRNAGIIRCAPVREKTPLHAIEQRFAQYLTQVRGLAKPTIRNYLLIVRTLLSERFDSKQIALDDTYAKGHHPIHRTPGEQDEPAQCPPCHHRPAQLLSLSVRAR